MPRVPYTSDDKVVPMQPVDPTVLAMTAAMMHEEGKLFEPPKAEPPKVPTDG